MTAMTTAMWAAQVDEASGCTGLHSLRSEHAVLGVFFLSRRSPAATWRARVLVLCFACLWVAVWVQAVECWSERLLFRPAAGVDDSLDEQGDVGEDDHHINPHRRFLRGSVSLDDGQEDDSELGGSLSDVSSARFVAFVGVVSGSTVPVVMFTRVLLTDAAKFGDPVWHLPAFCVCWSVLPIIFYVSLLQECHALQSSAVLALWFFGFLTFFVLDALTLLLLHSFVSSSWACRTRTISDGFETAPRRAFWWWWWPWGHRTSVVLRDATMQQHRTAASGTAEEAWIGSSDAANTAEGKNAFGEHEGGLKSPLLDWGKEPRRRA